MRILTSLTLPCALAVIVVTLTGCALSPQVVELHPTPDVSTRNLGNNTPLIVSGTDQRLEATFGTRGGIYGATSLIQAGNDVIQVMTEVVKRGLQAQGFNAYNPSLDAGRLDVQLKELSYVPEEGSVVNRVEVKAVIEAVATNVAGKQYVGTYRAGNIYQQPMTPSAKRNETMLNEVFTRALKQMLTDPTILNFAAGTGT